MAADCSSAIANTSLAMARASTRGTHTAYIRVAKPEDATLVSSLVHGLAEFEKLSHVCKATPEAMEHAIANRDTCKVTVLLLEIAENVDPGGGGGGGGGGGDKKSCEEEDVEADGVSGDGKSCSLSLPDRAGIDDETAIDLYMKDLSHVVDPDRSSFVSTVDSNRVVVGFVLFFPKYSTFLARQTVHIEDLFVRSPYRGRKFGTMLLMSAAKRAKHDGAQRVDWTVLNWNEKAISFYEKLGAKVHTDWWICRMGFSEDQSAVNTKSE